MWVARAPDEDSDHRRRGGRPRVRRGQAGDRGVLRRRCDERPQRTETRAPARLRPRDPRPDVARARRAGRPPRVAPRAREAPGAHPLGPIRHADEAAGIRARRVRLPPEAVRARRAARPRRRPALAPRQARASFGPRGESGARPGPPPGARPRHADRSVESRVPASAAARGARRRDRQPRTTPDARLGRAAAELERPRGVDPPAARQARRRHTDPDRPLRRVPPGPGRAGPRLGSFMTERPAAEGYRLARRAAMRILVIEDEPRILEFLRLGLEAEGFAVDGVEDGATGLRLGLTEPYELVVLDLLLPRRDGMRLLAELRRERPDLPVLVLSARSDLPTKLRSFDLGANDYLSKPFSFDELVARVRVHLRRGRESAEGSTLRVGDLHLDLTRRRAAVG